MSGKKERSWWKDWGAILMAIPLIILAVGLGWLGEIQRYVKERWLD